jgi:hypothetical protein
MPRTVSRSIHAQMAAELGIRWTIGDASTAGFEALRLSVHGAQRLFGSRAEYLILVNNISVAEAQRRAGSLAPGVIWRAAEPSVPDFLRAHLDDRMAEGVAWKFSPVRAFPGRFALALDNDVVLWEVPVPMRQWLEGGDPTACVIAEDVTPAHGKFAEFCGPAPRNSGIRGIGPDFDLEAALKEVLRRKPVLLESELDEQGLQIAAVSLPKPPLVVSLEDVTICSPFYPHIPHLGRCGAHFVGINVRHIPWSYYGQPATELRLKHWREHREEVSRRVGMPPGAAWREVA